MNPTTDFRWALIPKVRIGWGHPSALDRGEYAMVLQQRWTSGLVGVTDEWRDIPMIESGDPRYTVTPAGRAMLEGDLPSDAMLERITAEVPQDREADDSV